MLTAPSRVYIDGQEHDHVVVGPDDMVIVVGKKGLTPLEPSTDSDDQGVLLLQASVGSLLLRAFTQKDWGNKLFNDSVKWAADGFGGD